LPLRYRTNPSCRETGITLSWSFKVIRTRSKLVSALRGIKTQDVGFRIREKGGRCTYTKDTKDDSILTQEVITITTTTEATLVKIRLEFLLT
jgi:hypothetical protein